MNDSLTEFETALRNRKIPEPDASLRAAILGAVTAELLVSRTQPPRRSNELYWLAAMVAMVLMTLTMIFANRDEFSLRPEHASGQLAAEIQIMQQIETDQLPKGNNR